jgi:thiol-disulfide isomerase/thioredoxin
MIKSLFIMAFALVSLITAPASAMDSKAQAQKPMLVKFTAEWCGSCKILDPKLEQALSNADINNGLEVVVFDFTNNDTKAAAASLAGEKGLSDIFQKHEPKTGFSLMVDQNMMEQGRFTKENSVEEIEAALKTFIDNQPSS